jgi:hypothetical protein
MLNSGALGPNSEAVMVPLAAPPVLVTVKRKEAEPPTPTAP